MPELPEVEEVRRTLEPHLLGIPLHDALILRADFLTPSDAPLRNLIAHRFIRTLRHGKKLFCIADDDQTLLIHLGMSGRVDCLPIEAPIAAHTHVILRLQGGIDVRLRDPRRFGGLWYYPSLRQALDSNVPHLGKDALELAAADLAHWKTSRGRLKQRLLSQRDVAGLGNIYVDEALWAAKLHPLQLVHRISSAQIRVLVDAIGRVLRRSIASGGTTLRDYRNVSDQPGRFARRLNAYGRAGQPCRRCGKPLRAMAIAARTTVFCPACQTRR